MKQFADSVFFTVRMPRSAVMADKKMGMLQLLLRLSIFLYIVLFVMIWKKGYCVRVPLTGSMRLTLRAPSPDTFTDQPLPSYCCNTSSSSSSSSPSISSCAPNGLDPAAPGVRRPCWFVDENFATSISGDKATLATRIQRYPQTLRSPEQCAVPNVPQCWSNWLPNSSNPVDDVYVAHAESFTLGMTHGFTIKAPSTSVPQYFDLTGAAGMIVYTDNHAKQRPFDPCVVFGSKQTCSKYKVSVGDAQGNSSDIVTIGALLYAARIQDVIDEPCKKILFLQDNGDPYAPGEGYPCFKVDGTDMSQSSKRDVGITLNVIITYANEFGENAWGWVPQNPMSKDIVYTIEAKYQTGAGYTERRALLSQNLTSRLYDTVTGIRINVIQTGTILIPDFVTAMLNLMTGMGLLGVAAVVVSIMVESILPIIQTRFGYGKKVGMNYVNAAKKAVKVIDRDARLSLETAIKRPDMTQELLNPAERAAERRRGSNIESN